MKAGKWAAACALSAMAWCAHGAPLDDALAATVSGKRPDGAEMTVARIDRRAYAGITDQASFDRASRQAILAFTRELIAYENMVAAQKHRNRDDLAGVERLLDRFWKELLTNYQSALKTCADCEAAGTSDELRHLAGKAQVEPALREFYKAYLFEQFRLGALFQKVSSEIDVFNDNEITGAAFGDMAFLLSFDDGPSDRNGSSDRLIESLNRLGLHTVFFALGERLSLRQGKSGDLARLFANQCLASHGQTHQSHTKLKEWQASVLDSLAMAKSVAPDAFVNAFRPPYGQRRADSGDFFRRHGAKVVLWNIDSQDWHKKISAQDAVDRVVSLMLLRRKGIILFHDIHAKASVAIPRIFQTLENTAIQWLDCRNAPYPE